MVLDSTRVALLVSTFERPEHLRKCLLSIALQRGVGGQFEVIITDDGSGDDTLQVAADFAWNADFPVKVVTHAHRQFQLARCRNDGVLASRAPYLLFLDGDCLLPPDHVRQHLARRRAGLVRAGDCCRLSEEVSGRVDDQAIRAGRFELWAPPEELRRLAGQRHKAWFYNLVRHPTKPKLFGNNVGIWRQDYERVNGYDEQFEGWGCEDDDLRVRLRRAGVRIASILPWTRLYHLWHPPVPSHPGTWREGANVEYFRGLPDRSPRCRKGLVTLGAHGIPDETGREGFAELMFWPGRAQFSGRAKWKVLVVAEDAPRAQRPAADLVVTRRDLPDLAAWLASASPSPSPSRFRVAA